MEEPKRIYSLNLICYLKASGFNEYQYFKEEGKVYYCFPEDDPQVGKAITEYKNNTFLHEYLNKFKETKKEIRDLL